MDQLQTLVDDYPRLFKGSPPHIGTYVMAGWQPILARLCARIDRLLTDEEAQRFTVLQIKEKFGGLRFYYRFSDRTGEQDDVILDIQSPGLVQSLRVQVEEGTSVDNDIRELIREYVQDAERDAARTCEHCDQPGRIRNNGWLATLCDAHAAMREAR